MAATAYGKGLHSGSIVNTLYWVSMLEVYRGWNTLIMLLAVQTDPTGNFYRREKLNICEHFLSVKAFSAT